MDEVNKVKEKKWWCKYYEKWQLTLTLLSGANRKYWRLGNYLILKESDQHEGENLNFQLPKPKHRSQSWFFLISLTLQPNLDSLARIWSPLHNACFASKPLSSLSLQICPPRCSRKAHSWLSTLLRLSFAVFQKTMPGIDWERTFSLYEFEKELITRIFLKIPVITQ